MSDDTTPTVRLNRFLAQSGIASRRGADTLIAEGRASEAELDLDDLRRARRWFLGNSLHGLRQAELSEAGQGSAAPPLGELARSD